MGHLKISCKTLYILSFGLVVLMCLCMGACIFSSGLLSFSAELLYLRHHFTWSYIVKNSSFVLVVSLVDDMQGIEEDLRRRGANTWEADGAGTPSFHDA